MIPRLCMAIATVLFGSLMSASAFDPLDYTMTIPIRFECYNNHPYFSNDPIRRVNIDFSRDSGSNWTRRIAAGYPVSDSGENVYYWSVRVTPDLWTEHARIAVRSLWSSTTNVIIRETGIPGRNEGDMSDSDFSISGIRLLSPTNNATLRTPSYPTITWHEAGPNYVDIGYSTNSGASWVHMATVESRSATNSYQLPFEAPPGRVAIGVFAYSNLYHSATVTVIPW
jgi:hypothetical protein